MKKLLHISTIAVSAVIVTFFFVQCNSSNSKKTEPAASTNAANGKTLPVAYINADSVVANYQFAKDANEELVKKQEDARLQINTRAKQLQADMATFQDKVNNGAFASRERAEQENNRLLSQRKELEDLNQQLSNDLVVKQQKFNEQLRDSISTFLKSYAPAHNYQLVLSTNAMNDNVLYAVDSYNITKEIVKALNARYSKKK